MLESSSVLMETKSLKKSGILSGTKEWCPQGKTHPAKLPSVKSNQRKYQQPKADANIIERGGQVLAPSGSKIWWLWPCGFGFRVNNSRKGL